MKHLVELIIVHLNISGSSHKTGVNIKGYDFRNDAQGSKDIFDKIITQIKQDIKANAYEGNNVRTASDM